MAGFWERLKRGFTGESADNKYYNGDAMAQNYKSANDLYKEGSDVAARMGNEAAAQAGAQAKANAVMGGGSRMAAALAGANAANQAGTATFNNQLSSGTQVAAQQNQRQADAKNQAAQANITMDNKKDAEEQNRMHDRFGLVGNALASLFS